MTRAVVFDLWQTLVPLTAQVKDQAFVDTAQALGVEPSALRPLWSETRVRRETTNLADYLVELGRRLGAGWTDADLTRAMNARKHNHGKGFADIRPETVDTVRALRQQGFQIAVVSNCSSDVRDMLAESPLYPHLDEVVLSAEAGIMKPDPRIFRRAAERLGVDPGECLYVGDGMDHELDGASSTGMTAVLVDLGDGVDWAGQRVTSVRDIPDLVGTSPSVSSS